MNELDTTPQRLDDPSVPEMNLYFFFKSIADSVDELQHEILEHLVAAGTKRGWFPDLESVIARFTEHEPAPKVRAAVAKLQRQRLLVITDGAIDTLIGGITHRKTAFRAMTAEDNVPFHLNSALDALTIAPTLQRTTTVTSVCGLTGKDISITVAADGSLDATTPQTVTAFIGGWDGICPLREAPVARSHFFLSDVELNEWQTLHGDPDGMPLTQDTIRLVGTEMAGALAALYVRMSVR
ncbi:MAG: hypothetical protein ACI9OJ_005988 [Myxococcota bacterium]|jgi:hypothetical protein